MNLLDKFASVKIEADKRISPKDAEYCRQQQELYEKAGETLRAMLALVQPLDEDEALKNTLNYFPRNTDVSTLLECLRNRHGHFIGNIVSYFSITYQVELDTAKVQDALLPEKSEQPNYWYYENHREEWEQVLEAYKAKDEAYTDAMNRLCLRYEAIVEEIFSQLGGFSFEEKALSELFAKCYSDTHHKYWSSDPEESFELKGATLKLTGYFCKHSAYGESWEIESSMMDILRALAWFEGGRLDNAESWFCALLSNRWNLLTSSFEYPDYPHVRKIRLFKNHAVEIKFCDALAAQNFAETCLRSGKTEEAA